MNNKKFSGKGLLKTTTPRRHRKILRDNIQGVSNPALKRLSLKGGVERLQNDSYDKARQALHGFLTDLLKDADLIREHARRKTLMVDDVNYALERRGITYYG